ncbi:hypothetical protein TWF281_001674 [Arthrobotrys megalospora]
MVEACTDPESAMDLYEIPLHDLEAKAPYASAPSTETDNLFKRYAKFQRCLKYFYVHASIAYFMFMGLYIAFTFIENQQKIGSSHKIRDGFAVGVLISPILSGVSSGLSYRNIKKANDIRRIQVESGEPMWKPLSRCVEEVGTDVILMGLSMAMFVVGIIVITICETL